MAILQVADHHSLDLPASYDHMDRSYAYGYQEPRYPIPVVSLQVEFKPSALLEDNTVLGGRLRFNERNGRDFPSKIRLFYTRTEHNCVRVDSLTGEAISKPFTRTKRKYVYTHKDKRWRDRYAYRGRVSY